MIWQPRNSSLHSKGKLSLHSERKRVPLSVFMFLAKCILLSVFLETLVESPRLQRDYHCCSSSSRCIITRFLILVEEEEDGMPFLSSIRDAFSVFLMPVSEITETVSKHNRNICSLCTFHFVYLVVLGKREQVSLSENNTKLFQNSTELSRTFQNSSDLQSSANQSLLSVW